MAARVAVVLVALAVSGCAGARTGVVVATADGSERYVGERTRSGRDAFALTARSGAECLGDLFPTTDTTTGLPAAFGGVSCDDGRVGMLLFAGGPGVGGGAVSGVIDRRQVKGSWGGAPALRTGAGA